MKYYIIKINEICSNESISFGCDKLNLESYKAIKKQLVDTANRSGTGHELTLIEAIDNDHATNGCFIGRGYSERVLTRIKYGLTDFDKFIETYIK